MNLCGKLLNNFLHLCCCKLRYVAHNSVWLIFEWLFSNCTVDFFVVSKCAVGLQGGPKIDVLLIAFLQLGYG